MNTRRESLTPTRNTDQPTNDLEKSAYDKLRDAIDEGSIGDMITKHEELVSRYYKDVQEQANQSFRKAKTTAKIGIYVLILTLLYALISYEISRLLIIVGLSEITTSSLAAARIGLVCGILIEFISGIEFWLSSRHARQFGALHIICLERIRQYLLAYKIAEKIQDRKDETLEHLVRLIAKASMITREDIDFAGLGTDTTKSTQATENSAEPRKASGQDSGNSSRRSLLSEGD